MFGKTLTDKRVVRAINIVIAIMSMVIICTTHVVMHRYEGSMLFKGNKDIYQWGVDESISLNDVCSMYQMGFMLAIVVMIAFVVTMVRPGKKFSLNKATPVYLICLLCSVFSEIVLIVLSQKYDMTLYNVNEIGESLVLKNDNGMFLTMQQILGPQRVMAIILDVIIGLVLCFVYKKRKKEQ